MGSKVNKKQDDIQKRILETKLEIDELHQELQRNQLLNSNQFKPAERFVVGNQASGFLLKSPSSNNESEVKAFNTCKLTPALINDENVKAQKTSRKKSQSKGSEVESKATVGPYKNSAYDKEAVREYISRQQQKRAEERRKQKETKQDFQLRKERLEKLHKASLKIIANNVKHKREGSKSSERRSSNGDVSTAAGAGANQSKSSIKSGLSKETGKRLIKKTSSCGDLSSKQTFNVPSRSEVSNQNFVSATKNDIFRDVRLENERYLNPVQPQQNSTNKLHRIVKYGNGGNGNTLEISESKNITLRQHEISPNVSGNSNTKLNMRRLPFTIPQEMKIPQNELEEFPGMNTREKGTENNQMRTVHEKLETPNWLKAPSSLNFINSVRRKLKIVVSETPTCKDVGIQNSILEHMTDGNYAEKTSVPEKNTSKQNSDKSISSKQDIFEMLQRQIKSNHSLDSVDNLKNIKQKDPNIFDNNVNSQPDFHGPNKNIKIHDLKSFISHKLLLHSMEELPEGSKKSDLNKKSENEDSDTSKDIPDLPGVSESLKSLDSRIQLSKSTDIEKLEKLQLTRNYSLSNNNKSEDLYRNRIFPRGANDSNIKNPNYSDGPKSPRESLYSSDFHSPVASININSQERSTEDEIVHSTVIHSSQEVPTSEYLLTAESAVRRQPAKGKIIIESKIHDNTHDDLIEKVINNSKKSAENLNNKNGSEQDVSIKSINSKTSKITYSLKSPSDNHFESAIKHSSEESSSPIHTEGTTSTFNSSHQTTQPKLVNEELSQSINEDPKKSKFLNKNFQNNEAMSPLEAPLIYLHIDPNNQKVSSGNSSNLFKDLYFISHKDNNNGKPDVTEIHLKFEAEVHLLNDFNESVKQFMNVQKAFEDLKKMNDNPNASKMQNPNKRDKHTSERDETGNLNQNLDVNSRGSHLADEPLDVSQITNNTTFSITGLTDLEISNLDDTVNSHIKENQSIKNTESLSRNLIPLKIYEQLIKDEDVRIDNLKTIIKIREKSLLDRTKAELALLEIQRKQLKEAGELGKISDIKRKQRGILLKHQQERHEMQKLKHIQKAKSEERKKVLKEQRNLIKTQLTTNNMLTKIKVSRRRESKLSSPMKVVQYHSESICSDSSVFMSSFGEEVLSISSSHTFSRETQERVENSAVPLKHHKGALLMREVALRKRRTEAEELLKWHQKLLDEEKKITELESAAHTVINQIPSATFYKREPNKSHSFKGSQLNTLWRSITGKEHDKFIDDRTYLMSQIAFERFCKSAKDTFSRSSKHSDVKRQNSAEIDPNEVSVVHTYNIPTVNESDRSNSTMFSSQGGVQTNTSYTSDFENDSGKELRDFEKSHFELSKMSSISELINSFSKIKEEISSMSKKSANSISIQEDITSFASESKEKNVNIMNRINKLENSNVDNSISSVSNLISRIESVPDIVKSSKLLDSNLGNVSYQANNHSDQNISQNTSILHTKSDRANSSADETASKSIDVRNMANENSTKDTVLKDVDAVEEGILDMRLTESEHTVLHNNESKSNSLEKTHVQNYQIDSAKTSEDVLENKTSQLGKLESNSDSDIDEDSSIKTVELEKTDLEMLENITDEKLISVNKSTETSSSKHGDNELSKSLLEQTENKFLESIERSLRAVNTNLDSDVRNSETIFMSSQISGMEDLNKPISEENFENSVSIKETLSTEVKEVDEKDEQIATSSYNSNTFISSILSSPESKISNVSREFPKNDNNKIISLLKLPGPNEVVEENPENFSLAQNDQFPELSDENGDELVDTFLSSENEENKNRSESAEFVDPAEKLSDTSVSVFEIEHKSSKSTDEHSEDGNLISAGAGVISKSITDLITNHLKNNKLETEAGEASFSICTEESSKSALDEQSYNTRHDLKDTSFGEYEEKISQDNVSEKISEVNASTKISEDNVSEKIAENLVKEIYCDRVNGEINSVNDENNQNSSGSETELSREIGKLEHFDNCAEESSKYEDQLENVSEISHSENFSVEKHVPERMTEVNEMPFDDEPHSSTEDPISQNVCSEDSPERDTMGKIEDTTVFLDEAEELLKKQLAIEQEIKQLEQQTKQFDQQRIEPIPYVLLREIPNKPPPPYKPPAKMKSVMPSCAQDIEEVTSYAANVFYKAFLSNNLQNVHLTQSSFNLVSKRNINGQCCEFLFDLCKEFCLNHYSQFERKHPSWLVLKNKPKFSVTKPMDAKSMEKYLNKKIKELSGLQKVNMKESVIIKWSRKKRDYVDEVLVSESLAEENEWTEYDQDELDVKDQLTNDIMTKLLNETSVMFNKLFS